jgi:hypothetical protein
MSELHVRLRQASKHIWLTSCVGLNIGAHKEAAEHFLSALVMQESTNGQTSDQLWFTLRRAFIAMVNIFIIQMSSANPHHLRTAVTLLSWLNLTASQT